jgi:hypothetical protein
LYPAHSPAAPQSLSAGAHFNFRHCLQEGHFAQRTVRFFDETSVIANYFIKNARVYVHNHSTIKYFDLNSSEIGILDTAPSSFLITNYKAKKFRLFKFQNGWLHYNFMDKEHRIFGVMSKHLASNEMRTVERQFSDSIFFPGNTFLLLDKQVAFYEKEKRALIFWNFSAIDASISTLKPLNSPFSVQLHVQSQLYKSSKYLVCVEQGGIYVVDRETSKDDTIGWWNNLSIISVHLKKNFLILSTIQGDELNVMTVFNLSEMSRKNYVLKYPFNTLKLYQTKFAITQYSAPFLSPAPAQITNLNDEKTFCLFDDDQYHYKIECISNNENLLVASYMDDQVVTRRHAFKFYDLLERRFIGEVSLSGLEQIPRSSIQGVVFKEGRLFVFIKNSLHLFDYHLNSSDLTS